MNKTLNTETKGVVCLFCGVQTPVANNFDRSTPKGHRASIIRCECCGKEAPYYPSEAVQPDVSKLHDAG